MQVERNFISAERVQYIAISDGAHQQSWTFKITHYQYTMNENYNSDGCRERENSQSVRLESPISAVFSTMLNQYCPSRYTFSVQSLGVGVAVLSYSQSTVGKASTFRVSQWIPGCLLAMVRWQGRWEAVGRDNLGCGSCRMR